MDTHSHLVVPCPLIFCLANLPEAKWPEQSTEVSLPGLQSRVLVRMVEDGSGQANRR